MSSRIYSNPLRILQVASGDLWAGAEVQLFTLCSGLVKNKSVQLKVFLLNHGELEKRLMSKGIDVVVADETALSFFEISRLLYKHCRSFKPDLMHSHRLKENILAGLFKCLLRVPSIRTVHGAMEFNVSRLSVQGFLLYLNNLVGKYLQDYAIAVSDDLKYQIDATFGRNKVVVIRNGVAYPKVPKSLEANSENNFRIGCVGRLTKVKRIDLFVEMAALLTQEELPQDVEFYIVGDGPLRDELEAMSRRFGVEEKIKFTGHVDSAAEYIKSFDVLVMPSDHEGTPMTLLEAMVLGTPVVAHNVGGLSELLDGGNCGLLVSDHTSPGYQKAVCEILITSEKTKNVVENAKKRIEQQYSAKTNSEEYLKLYERVINI